MKIHMENLQGGLQEGDGKGHEANIKISGLKTFDCIKNL